MWSCASRQALLKLGGVEQTRQDIRRARGSRRLEELAADVRYAGRTLGESPGFTAAAIRTLAHGSRGEPARVTGQLVTGNCFDVLGVRLALGVGRGRLIRMPLVEVIGMIRGIRHSSIGERPGPHFFVPAGQYIALATDHLLVRTAGDPSALTAPVRAAIRELDPHLPGFGLVALLLAALGLYGVVAFAFAVAGRARETRSASVSRSAHGPPG
ncbi:MAG: hypothetical protein ACODAE_08985 [Gemmatimonadota bacterium]